MEVVLGMSKAHRDPSRHLAPKSPPSQDASPTPAETTFELAAGTSFRRPRLLESAAGWTAVEITDEVGWGLDTAKNRLPVDEYKHGADSDSRDLARCLEMAQRAKSCAHFIVFIASTAFMAWPVRSSTQLG